MTAHADILGLMHAYCRAIDRGDFKTFGRLLRDALWLVEGQLPDPASGQNIIIYADGTPRTKHVISNIQIDVAADGQNATAHSYVRVYQQTPALPLCVIFAGEYFDEYDCDQGTWRLRRRDLRHPLYGDLSHHLRNPQLTFPDAPVA